MGKYLLIKPSKGGQAFWRSVIAALKEKHTEFEVKQLWLNEKRSSSLYIFPANVIDVTTLRAAAAHLELPDFTLAGWRLGYRTLKVNVRKCRVSSYWMFAEYETTYLEIESTDGERFYVFRNKNEAEQCLSKMKAQQEIENKYREYREVIE